MFIPSFSSPDGTWGVEWPQFSKTVVGGQDWGFNSFLLHHSLHWQTKHLQSNSQGQRNPPKTAQNTRGKNRTKTIAILQGSIKTGGQDCLTLQMLGPKLLYQRRLSSRDVYSSSRACSLPDGIGFPQPHNHLCPFLASNTHVTTNRACLIGGFLHVQVKQILYLLKCFPYKTQTS